MNVVHACTSDSSNRAIPGEDFDFLNITNETQHINFTISAGSTMSLPLTVIDDNVAEYTHEYVYFDLGIYDSGQRLHCDYKQIVIEDNDGKLH